MRPMIPSFWKQSKEHVLNAARGRPQTYDNPEDLAIACVGYFDWCEQNVILEEVLVNFQGVTTRENKAHPMPMIIRGLCNFIGVNEATWRAWRQNRPDLHATISWAEEVIYKQKFAGAASGQFNANLIARSLGLADKSELTGRDGGPIETLTIDPSKISIQALKEILAAKHNVESDDS